MRLVIASLFVLVAVGCGDTSDLPVGFVACGDIECGPGLHCERPNMCSPGCLSRANCADGEYCNTTGTVRLCVPFAEISDAGVTQDGSLPDVPTQDVVDLDSGDPDAEPFRGCGDRRCALDESFDSCPADCPAPGVAECTLGCEALSPLGSCTGEPLNNFGLTLCLNVCAAATSEQVSAFGACATGPACTYECVRDHLSECGDGRCEGYEPLIGTEFECAADCGAAANGTDCLRLCESYESGGCIDAVATERCRQECLLEDEAGRAAFMSCATPLSARECSGRDCLRDFGVTCADGSCGTCGDGRCAGGETYSTCPGDCRSTCGDGFCSAEENCLCTLDCGSCSSAVCGDGICNGVEDCTTCSGDCGTCARSCRDGFFITKGPWINRNTDIGAPCNDESGSNCPDGTAIHLANGQCICSLHCDVTRFPVGTPCSASGEALCQDVASSTGDRAVLCTLPEWNICSAE